ncbi:MAG: hypothetical protein U9N60_11690, partial [Thermodesulfobacteriota bacterium]|nr:hypothetical protein [Thermodesulfobacteriota bacterium]
MFGSASQGGEQADQLYLGMLGSLIAFLWSAAEYLQYLIITNPSCGHVIPIIPIARELVKSGHTVKWINGRAFKEKV